MEDENANVKKVPTGGSPSKELSNMKIEYETEEEEFEGVKDAKMAKMDPSATTTNKTGNVETEEEEKEVEEEDDDEVEDNEEDEDFYGYGWEDDDIALEDVPLATKREPPKDISPLEFSMETFKMLEYLPPRHKYSSSPFNSSQTFLAAYNRDVNILRENLPSGIWVRGYEQRLDLFSVLIAGPQNTPYEGSLFAFEIQLTDSYPKNPPLFHYISFSKNRINPNLYTEGKVCVSLLGTWHGQKQSEKWNEKTSTILQVVLSIQALILVPEPYFNEPGHEKSFGTASGTQGSRDYNERTIATLLNSSAEMLKSPPSPWQLEITRFLKQFTPKTVERIQKWIKNDEEAKPDFPLYPISYTGSFKTAMKALEDAVTTYCDAVVI